MKFDPIRIREVSDNAIDRAMGTEFDNASPMGNVAASMLGEVVRAWLVGCSAQIAPAIPRANQWLDEAISNDERLGGNLDFHRMKLHWARAMGAWLDTGWNAEGNWDSARVFAEAAWRCEKRPWTTNEIVKTGLDDYLAFAYKGGEHNDGFEAGVEMYERWVGHQSISLKKVLKPKEFGYALCLYRARQQFDSESLFLAGRKMLRANLGSTWLGPGQYLRAATWLKIVYELADTELSPLGVILRAYDDMPNVPRPNFV
ncbi:hypothetical protein PQR46_00670 [Paraburkholderia sediminicola]|uniref:hypothetical protein n=1 Tax=Paraburkholderia TaxID=1822464 RepID=UPI0038BDE8F4